MEISSVIPEAHSSAIICLAYNPFEHRLFTGSEDHLIKVWDPDTGKFEKTLVKHTGPISDLIYCPSCDLVFSCSTDGTIVCWSKLLKVFYEKKLSMPCATLAWDDKKKTLMAGMKNLIYFYRVNKNRTDPMTSSLSLTLLETLFFVELTGFVRCMTSFEGKLVVGSFDRAITIYDTATGKQTVKIQNAHKAAVSVVAYDQDNARFITGGFDKKIKIWNLDGTTVFEIGGFSDVITGICYNQKTKTIWVAANSPKPQVFDPFTGTNLSDFLSIDSDGNRGLQLLMFAPFTGEIIGTSSSNRGIISWRHNPFTPVATINSGPDVIETVCYSVKKHGSRIFTGGADCKVKRWEFNSVDSQIKPHESYSGHSDSILVSQYYEPLDILITGSADKNIRIFSYTTLPKRVSQSEPVNTSPRGVSKRKLLNRSSSFSSVTKQPQPIIESGATFYDKISGLDVQYVLPGHNDRITGITCFRTGDCHYLVSVSWDLTIIVWEINKENNHIHKMILDAHNDYITDIDYCPMRNEIGTSSVDGTAKIWSMATYQQMYILEGHTSEISKIRWFKSMESWVTASHDGTIKLWSIFGIQYQTIRTPGSITAMCIDRNSWYLVVACSDHRLRVYDPNKDIIIQENAGHTDVITSITHLKEYNQYLTTSWDQTIRIWWATKDGVYGGNANHANNANAIQKKIQTLPLLGSRSTMNIAPLLTDPFNDGEGDFEYTLKLLETSKPLGRAKSNSLSGSGNFQHLMTTIDDQTVLARFKTNNNQKALQFLKDSYKIDRIVSAKKPPPHLLKSNLNLPQLQSPASRSEIFRSTFEANLGSGKKKTYSRLNNDASRTL